jgi:hypothetical protein|tara:strand:- start:298 stop:429 length:132 start_codon:yes stop_codon:yes gene_type:complete
MKTLQPSIDKLEEIDEKSTIYQWGFPNNSEERQYVAPLSLVKV